MTQLSFPLQQPPAPNQELQAEMTWGEVAKGLNRILLGNLILIILPLFGALLFAVAIARNGNPLALVDTEKFRSSGYEMFFLFMGGILAIAVAGLVGYPMILFGRIQCLVNVPERCGAKWLMFVCVLALIAGPALGFLAGFFGAGNDRAAVKGLKKTNPAAVRKVEELLPRFDDKFYLRSYFWLNMGGIALSVTSEVCFLLFLRSVAHCFNSPGRVTMVDCYFVLFGGILLTVLYLLFGGPVPIVALVLLLAVGLGSLASVVWYLVLLGSTSWCITEGMERLKPPPLTPSRFGTPD